MIKKIDVMRLLVVVMFCVVSVGGFSQQLSDLEGSSTYGFIQNNGQVVDQNHQPNNAVKYILLRPGLNVQVRTTGFSYDTYTKEVETNKERAPLHKHKTSSAKLQYHRVDISFPGSNPTVKITPFGRNEDPINYIGQRNITSSHFSGVVYENLYDGIDLKLYTNAEGAFEYDFVVRPGAIPERIRLDYVGQNSLVAAGDRAIGIMVRQGELREQIPASYLADTGKNVDVRFKLDDNQHSVSFAVPEYDRSQTLVIDPMPNLLWATYYGGPDGDEFTCVATDASDNIYAGGMTSSSNGSFIIATSGTHQSAEIIAGPDGFFAVFNSAGVRQIGVYFGGPGADYIWGIVPDASGNIYVTGSTTSSSDIASGGTWSQDFFGTSQAFLAKFSSLGTKTWATYYGGFGEEEAYDIFLNSFGFPVITGLTSSTDPSIGSMTGGQLTHGGGTYDAFIATFQSSDGQGTSPRCYYGGTGDEAAYSFVRDGSSNIYMSGATNTTTGLATTGQTIHGGGLDGFVAEFTSAGVNSWMSYYGGEFDDEVNAIDVDPTTGNSYIVGATESSVGISTSGAFKEAFNTSFFADGFIAKFNNIGTRQWGTYFGGEDDDELSGISETGGTLLLTGYSQSTSGVATAGSYQSINAGVWDAVVASFDSDGIQQWSSYLGGDDYETGVAAEIDASGNFIVVGHTYSTSGMSTPGSHQPSFGGSYDGFVSKFETGSVGPATPPTITSFLETSGPVGSVVSITGTNFSPTSGDNTVYFGSTKATDLGGDATILNVAVPDGSIFKPISVTTNAGLTAYSQQPYIVTVADLAPLSATSFLTKQDINGFNVPYGVAAGDFDNDGKADLAIANRGNNGINVNRNESSIGIMSFPTSLPFGTAGVEPLNPVAADIDGDGKLDLAAVNGTSGTVSLLRNTSIGAGSITFDAAVVVNGTGAGVAAIEDLDGDGKPELVATNPGGGYMSVYGNTSTVGIISMDPIADLFGTSANPYGVAIGDIDGDGLKDIVVANNGASTITVFRNTSTVGNINFASSGDFSVSQPWMVALADFDTDGALDIAVTSLGLDQVIVFRNISSVGSILMDSPTANLSSGSSTTGLALDDIDGDGKVDIVSSASAGGIISVFKNYSSPANLSFSTRLDFATGLSPTYVMAIVDLDGDRKKDIAVANASAGAFSIHQNNLVALANEPFGQPTDFAATGYESSIDVSWTAPGSAPAGYIVFRAIDSAPVSDPEPQDGTTYTEGQTFGNAEVVYVGSSTFFNDDGLGFLWEAHYKIYSYNGSGGSINYLQAGPLEGIASTTSSLATEPTEQPSAFNATPSLNSIFVSYSAPVVDVPEGYIIVRGLTQPDTAPNDGATYAQGEGLGNAFVIFTGNSLTFDDTGLTEGTQYFYEIYSYNGSSLTINYLQNTPLEGSSTTTGLAPEPIDQPDNFVGVPNDVSISVTFDPATDTPDGYIVLRAAGSTPNVDPLDGTVYNVNDPHDNATVAFVGSGTSFTDTGLTPLTSYNYEIFSYNGSGSAINYLQLTPLSGGPITTLTPEPAEQPHSFVATPSQNSIAFSFTVPSDLPEGFLALRAEGVPPDTDPVDGVVYNSGDPYGNAFFVLIAPSTVTGTNDTGLTEGTTYHYKIYSYDGSGGTINYRQFEPLEGTSTTTGLAPEPTEQPANFNPTPFATSISISFDATGTPVAGYIVLRGNGAGVFPDLDPVDGVTYNVNDNHGTGTQVAYIGSSTSFDDIGLTELTTYNYEIYSYNGSGASINYLTTAILPLSGSSTTTSLAGEPAEPPTSYGASASDNIISVSFVAPVPAPDGYFVLRGTDVPNEDPVDGIVYTLGESIGNAVFVYIGSTTSFNDTGLDPGTQYYYKIYSYNGTGSSTNYLQSNVLEGSTVTTGLAPEPTEQPAFFSETPSSNSIFVSFNAAAIPPAGYIVLRATSVPNADPTDGVEYSVGGFISFAEIVSIGDVTSFDDAGLDPSTTYYYKIYSYNGVATSTNYLQDFPLEGFSTTTGSSSEPTSQPSNFGATGVSNSQVEVSFSSAVDSPSGYLVIRAPVSAPSFVPTDGIPHCIGQSVGGNDVVAYVGPPDTEFGPTTTFFDTGLSALTVYEYRVYSYNGSGASINYLTSTSPLQGSGQTTNSPPVVPSAFPETTSPVTDQLNGIQFLTPVTAVAVGHNGTIIRSTDEGESWEEIFNPAIETIWNLAFSTKRSGIAIGNNGLIMRTDDAGANWTTITGPTSDALYAADFVDGTEVGYAVGDLATALKTTDGGNSWVVLPNTTPLTDSYFNAVYFRDFNVGFIAGPDGVFKTSDGGDSWTTVSSEAILWMSFPTSTVGYAVGISGVILKTTTGGDSWAAQTSGIGANLWGAHFIDQNIGFAVGEEGTILKTTDGGTNWTSATKSVDITIDMLAIHFGSNPNGVAIGSLGYLTTAIPEPQPLVLTPINPAPPEIEATTGSVNVGFSIPATEIDRVLSVTLKVITITNEAKGIAETLIDVDDDDHINGTYSQPIQETGLEKIGYKYSYEVSYDAEFGGRTATTPESYVYVKWTTATNQLKLTNLRTGSDQKDYQLISVPLQLTNASVTSVFDEFGATYDRNKYRLYTATGTTSTTTNEEKSSGNLEIGKGYWLITTGPNSVTLGPGKAYQAKADDPYTFNWSAGYVLIGNPYNFSVPWNGGTNVKDLKTWNGTGWVIATTLDPFKGYFIDVEAGGSYDLPIDGGFDGGRSKRFGFEQNFESWALKIDLTQGEYKNELAEIGMHPEATLGYDAPDERVFPMPEFTKLPSMSIDRPEAGFNLEQDIVPTGTNQTWEFTLFQEGDSRAVTMSWDNELIAAIGRDLYLFDEEQLLLINMQATNQHQAMSNTRLKIITGDPLFVKSEVSFGNSRIGALYPNPAANAFSVPVAMPKAGEVHVQIYDMQGKEVSSQVYFAEEGLQNISVTGLPEGLKGLYLVAAESMNSGRKVQKIIFR